MRTRHNLMVMGIALLAACAQDESGTEQSAGVAETAQSTAGGAPSAGPAMTAQMAAGCPTAVEGTQVTASDTDGGVALTFTTTGDVNDLRQRVGQMAQMYAMHQGQGHMMWRGMGGARGGMGPGARGGMHGGMGPGAQGGMGPGARGGMGPMPAMTTRVNNVDNGASLVLTPTDPAQLDALRARARSHAQRMQSGQCWTLRR